METSKRRMHRGWAITAACFALVLMLHCLRMLWQDEYLVVLQTPAKWITAISQYLSVGVFGFFAACFFRQKADRLMASAFWFCIIESVLTDVLFGLFAQGYGLWNATNLLSSVIPYVLLALCCSQKEELRPEKGTKVVVTVVVLAILLEILMIGIKLFSADWRSYFPVFVEHTTIRLSHAMMLFAAVRAVETPAKETTAEQ